MWLKILFKDASVGATVGRLVHVDDPIEAFKHLHGRAVVVKVKSLYVLQNIYCILKDLKLQEGLVRCFGGFSVLIVFSSSEHVVMAKDELIGRPDLFKVPTIWEGQPFSFDRVVVINNVRSLFGTIVKEAQMDSRGCDASLHFVGVLVDHGKSIQEEAFLRGRGTTFKVWVVEEYKEWIEEFVKDPKVVGGS
ncbi:hypothetical protein Hanom_Chr15g01391681 [Helianthus anomalus]